MATQGYGSLLQRGCKVASHLHTGVIGNNNAILWTAVTEGVAGDNITVHLIDPGGTSALAVSVATLVNIDVSLATNTGSITSTAAEVIAAVRAHNEASKLVVVTNDSTSTGLGVMVAAAQAPLASGSDTETFTSIAECRNITGPSMTLGTVETTHMSSTAAYREYIATVLDAGEIGMELNFLPADTTQNQIVGILKDIKSKILRHFKLILTDTAATTWTFYGYVTALSNAASVDGKLTANITIRISGQPTLA